MRRPIRLRAFDDPALVREAEALRNAPPSGLTFDEELRQATLRGRAQRIATGAEPAWADYYWMAKCKLGEGSTRDEIEALAEHDEPLVMVLDHINGVPNDNRIENLRMLCPNCNSQQATFAGRKNRKATKACPKCGVPIIRTSIHCSGCREKPNARRVKERPTNEILLSPVAELGWCGTARLYGVSDNAIRKWLK